jgi:hypothetical protein
MGVDGLKPNQPEAPKTVAVQVERENETKLEVGINNW